MLHKILRGVLVIMAVLIGLYLFSYKIMPEATLENLVSTIEDTYGQSASSVYIDRMYTQQGVAFNLDGNLYTLDLSCTNKKDGYHFSVRNRALSVSRYSYPSLPEDIAQVKVENIVAFINSMISSSGFRDFFGDINRFHTIFYFPLAYVERNNPVARPVEGTISVNKWDNKKVIWKIEEDIYVIGSNGELSICPEIILNDNMLLGLIVPIDDDADSMFDTSIDAPAGNALYLIMKID